MQTWALASLRGSVKIGDGDMSARQDHVGAYVEGTWFRHAESCCHGAGLHETHIKTHCDGSAIVHVLFLGLRFSGEVEAEYGISCRWANC